MNKSTQTLLLLGGAITAFVLYKRHKAAAAAVPVVVPVAKPTPTPTSNYVLV